MWKKSAVILMGLGVFSLTIEFVFGHGSALSPLSRVLRVYQSNPENPNFELARQAVEMDGKDSYYTWNQISQNQLIQNVYGELRSNGFKALADKRQLLSNAFFYLYG